MDKQKIKEKLDELFKAAKRKQEIIIKQNPNKEFYKTEDFYSMLVDDLIDNLLTTEYYTLKHLTKRGLGEW